METKMDDFKSKASPVLSRCEASEANGSYEARHTVASCVAAASPC